MYKIKKEVRIFFLYLIVLSSFIEADAAEADSSAKKSMRLFAYPYAFYTPETKFAFGGGVILNFFAGDEDINPSQSVLGGYYSTNHNFYSSLNTHIYHKSFYLHPWIYAAKVVDKFYGIGNNSVDIKDDAFYNAKKVGVRVSFEKYVKKFIFGLVFDWSYWSIYDKLTNPYLINDRISGSDGGYTSGFGLLFGLDTRDYVFLPTDGSYHEFKIIHFNEYFGGDFVFTKYQADLRGYHTFFNRVITGWQFYGEGVTGDTPFYYLPALGGSEIMRGYYEGRYRDNFYLAAQAEAGLLFRIFKKMNRFGAVIFVSCGEVAHEIYDFNMPSVKVSYGVGFGYMLDEEDRTVLRAEFGFGKGTSGIYFAAGLPF
jgi:outer membrane protein assembly factor BamA